jgi:DinB superfamily
MKQHTRNKLIKGGDMISTKELLEAFARNSNIIQQQTEGLSHEQCLLQLPFRGNCMNWVLGHIAGNRNSLLKALGEKPIMTEQEAARYGHGSEPVCADGEGVIQLDRLLSMLQYSQERIAVALPRLTPHDLDKMVKDHRGEVTLGNRLFFLYFHETYHTGQTELLRQLAGKDDKVI